LVLSHGNDDGDLDDRYYYYSRPIAVTDFAASRHFARKNTSFVGILSTVACDSESPSFIVLDNSSSSRRKPQLMDKRIPSEAFLIILASDN
jgi:hypothetical protein